MLLAFLLSIVFFVLSLIHFNWARGGRWGFDVALPTSENGERILNPSLVDSLIVGIGLLGFSLFYLYTAGILDVSLPAWVVKYGRLVIPLIFFVRAVGDFKYVGFFRKVKHTRFAKMDAQLFSPLCLTVGIMGMLIVWLGT